MGLTMFALFEAGNQVVFTMSTPRFGSASRGANHVSPLRGDYAMIIKMFVLWSCVFAPRRGATWLAPCKERSDAAWGLGRVSYRCHPASKRANMVGVVGVGEHVWGGRCRRICLGSRTMVCGDRRCEITMFALFEAGSQVISPVSTPRFGFASRGANHVSPLRGDCAMGFTMFALL